MIKNCLLTSYGLDTLHIDVGIDFVAVCKSESTLPSRNRHFPSANHYTHFSMKTYLVNDMQKRCACVNRHDV
ncbi:hypothetical protein MACJ_003563 [Theileria orientalis]|uniref:Uncharacterized protein n=1 Tax=Theileria orientalis TaxID=68886 RepID=A0A976SL40_THEOR|nr:hypothetical protein MACJ_003563 [Theileria orientalis]